MKTFTAVALALGVGSHALVARQDTCYFDLTAEGGQSGKVVQLEDGQNRIGGDHAKGKYSIDESGGLTDDKGRGCILTPPTTQFQCDTGASPTPGFSVDCDGKVKYQDSTTFHACPTGDMGSYNIYTVPPPNQDQCVEITLSGDSCKPDCPASTSESPAPHYSPPPTPEPKPAPKHEGCPTDLSGEFEYPHLIVPIDSSNADHAEGTSYFGEVSSTVSSIFNFDIKPSDAGKTCSLVFFLPKQEDLDTSSFSLSGSGGIDFSKLSGPASSETTYNNAPGEETNYGVTTVAPGNSYTIATFDCPANKAVGYKLSAEHDTKLHYFQDYNPNPIGLFITVC
ncbi:MAG: hypothetical protein M1837_003788 [Sclerophora amabilis]|nr:MAG: hypothetical protein M1837_003788 [Sclerophora amabilis]